MAEVITRFKADTAQYDRKIKDAKKSLDQLGLSSTSVGRALGSIKNAFTAITPAVAGLAAGVGVAAGAIKVVGDAFKQNEVVMDSWRANIEGAKGVYDGFLNALNTGDFGGFFRNIDNIVNAARAAYNALDELGTFNAFNQIQLQGAKTALTEAINSYKEGSISKEELLSAANELKNELSTRQRKEQEAYSTAVPLSHQSVMLVPKALWMFFPVSTEIMKKSKILR